MKYKSAYIIILFGILSLFCACESLQQYPDEPQISFTSLTLSEVNGDYEAVLEFNLIDGDGDIGIDQPDQPAPDTLNPIDSLNYYNFFSNFFYKDKGTYLKVIFKDLKYDFRIPRIEKDGQDKSVKADIFVDMLFSPVAFNFKDTFKFEFYVYDRSLNKSNVETITDFVFKEGVITSKTPE